MIDPLQDARGVDAGLFDDPGTPSGSGALFEQAFNRGDPDGLQFGGVLLPDALNRLNFIAHGMVTSQYSGIPRQRHAADIGVM